MVSIKLSCQLLIAWFSKEINLVDKLWATPQKKPLYLLDQIKISKINFLNEYFSG